MNKILERNINKLSIIFNDFKSATQYTPNKLEIDIHTKTIQDTDKKVGKDDNEAGNNLYKKYILHQIFYCLTSSKISEESSRMLTMNNASQNCSELIDKLTLKMNKIRQFNITKELIEIISGAESV